MKKLLESFIYLLLVLLATSIGMLSLFIYHSTLPAYVRFIGIVVCLFLIVLIIIKSIKKGLM